MRTILLGISGFLLGCIIGIICIYFTPFFTGIDKSRFPIRNLLHDKQVIGFLPYWLLVSAQTDYSPYITTLTYFGLNLDNDGSILKLANPQEEEPGWNALSSGKVDPFLKSAREKDISLSLLIFDGSQDSIDAVMSDPIPHADTLIQSVTPLMRSDQFTDLNLDIESVITASPSSQQNFTQFIREVKKEMNANHLGTLTVEISPTDLIRHDLIDVKSIAPYADYIVLMAYDYHYTGSYVTGPVAPMEGVGTVSEYDTQTAVDKALQIIPSQQLILGVPLYGYAWETITDVPRSAIVPDSGLSESSKDIASFVQSCATCSATFDTDAREEYLIYKDQTSGTYHQIFYPNEDAMQAKTDFADTEDLRGIALWALGYEDSNILNPLKGYK